MKFKKLLMINLHLFDGGSSAAGSGDGAGATVSGDVGAKGDTKGAVPGSTRRGKSGDFSNVLFGKQSDGATVSGSDNTSAQNTSHDAGADNVSAAESGKDGPAQGQGVDTTSNTLEERRKAFREMVTRGGEFKEVFDEEVQRHINRRFSDYRVLQTQTQEQKQVIDMLSQRYNIQDGDVQKLISALENDNAYWSEAAEEAGMSVDQYKQFQKLKRDNAALLSEQKGRQAQDQRQVQVQKWFEEAQAVKAKFPKFDLTAELQDPSFAAMLRAGTPVEHAYKVRHFDELMDNAMQVTTESTEKRVVENVRARGNRPAENGTTAQSAFTIRDDVSKLTKKERAEIARRATRGDKISF